ncbi:hypothetical protein SAMN05421788_103240 [Filimonas lacunae]|uniref:Uncharacterized protein n=1 Tax=Filimonas lacunae TaxID=477680 RepID=A0A1N7P6G2_9BACT|nr:hypothetical protein [Filimonas lacunae]SIT06140.1 hypothetical protein SAMN05421788_103240 [Filimonas lacunae]
MTRFVSALQALSHPISYEYPPIQHPHEQPLKYFITNMEVIVIGLNLKKALSCKR